MEFRDRMIKLLGLPWEKCPRNMEVLEETAADRGYRRYLIAYNVEKEERIKAWLLVPDNVRGRMPAVVACHQHNVVFDIGKAEPAGLAGLPEMAYGEDLCLRGFVVICPDMLCFEDRRPPQWSSGEYSRDCTYEKIEYLNYLAQGSSLTAKYLHDYTCAVDVLWELPYVDRARLFSFGHSTGGQCSLWLAWYDERLCGGVSSCGFARIRDLQKADKDHNLAMIVPGMLSVGDYDSLLADMAPKPFAFTCGMYDPTFIPESMWIIKEEAEKAYAEKGAADKLFTCFFEGWHWLKGETKEALYSWLAEQSRDRRRGPESE